MPVVAAGADPEGDDRPPLNPAKATLFTIILYNSENNIRDIRPFCHQLFGHSIVVKYASSLLQWGSRYES